MATGDVYLFEEAMAYMFDGGWEASDIIKCAVINNTLTPIIGQTTPSYDDYSANEVTAAGTYTTGGESIGTWGAVITQTSGVTKMDSATDPTWLQDPLNATDAWWGILYNDTAAGNPAIAFIELGGPFDMQAGDLIIAWAAGGIFTVT